MSPFATKKSQYVRLNPCTSKWIDRIEPRSASTPHLGSDCRNPTVCPTAKSTQKHSSDSIKHRCFHSCLQRSRQRAPLSCRARSNCTTIETFPLDKLRTRYNVAGTYDEWSEAANRGSGVFPGQGCKGWQGSGQEADQGTALRECQKSGQGQMG